MENAFLLERVSRLERQNRCVIILLLALVMAVLMAAAGGQAPTSKSKIIEAQAFVIRDEKGRLRAKLSLDDSGPALVFYDSKPRTVSQRNGSEKIPPDLLAVARTHLGLLDGDGSFLMLSSSSGTAGVAINAPEKGPSISISDSNGKGQATVAMNEGKGPIISLTSADDVLRAILEITTEEPAIQLFTNGEIAFKEPKVSPKAK